MKKKLTRKEKIKLQQHATAGASQKKSFAHTASSPKLRWTLALIVGALGFLLYANTLGHYYTLDDYSIIKENQMTRKGTDAISEIFKSSYRAGYFIPDNDLYRPIPKMIFAIQWSLAPDNPAFAHFVNVLFYALTGIFLFLTLLKYLNGNLLLSFLVSILYLAHPIHTDAVASIKSLDEVLAFFFFIVSLYTLYPYMEKNHKTGLILSLLFFALSLLCKESSITFLAVYPLAIYFFTHAPVSKNITVTVLMAAIAGIFFLVVRQKVLGHVTHGVPSVVDNLLIAAHGDLAKEKATAIMILGLYLKLFLFPHPLVSDYSYQQIQLITFSDWRFLVSFVLLAGLFVFALKNIRRRDVLTFGILFFFITASVVSNVFAIIGTSMAERLMYAPSFGFAMATGVLLVRILKADENRLYLNLTQFFYSNGRVFLLTAVILILYSFKTITRNSDWENNYTLYTADVQNSPNSARTHYYLGNYLVKNEYLNELDSTARSKALDRAVSELHQAIKLFPQFADAYNELGKAYIEKKDLQNAGKNYKTAIDINPTNPTYHNNYGTILFQTGKYDEAISEFHEAIKWNPCYADALSNLGSCYGTAGKFDDAITYFKKAIGCDPAYASAYYFLGMTYRYKKDETNAQQYLNKAYDLNPALKKK